MARYQESCESLLKILCKGWSPVMLLLGAVLLAESAAANDAPPSAADLVFFESQIRPILANTCYACHGPDRAEGGLRLDAPPAVPAVALRDVFQNPGATGHPLVEVSASDLDAIVEWTARGGPWPPAGRKRYGRLSMGELIAVTRENHWAFRPVVPPDTQAVAATEWVRTPIDTFVLAALEQAGLDPSPQADRRSLLRRAYYDLIGLPPTLEEIVAFEQDARPDAFARIVDQLLASPRYGERWARHWLDVARYSDTRGSEFREDRLFPFSHTYRDYVIRAFNEDLPFDQFILQQLAADQLDLGEDKRPLAAMGFLTLGRPFGNNIHDRIDDQIDVVMRGMQGLTVNCARCHDHKFDPITAADYYALYGVFRSSQEPESLPLLNAPDASTPGYQAFLQDLAKAEAARDALEQELQTDDPNRTLERADRLRLAQRRAAVQTVINTHPGRPDRAMALEDAAELFDPYIFNRGDPSNTGEPVARRFLTVLSDDTPQVFTQGSGRLELARAIASRDNPLTARVFVNRVWMHLFDAPLAGTPSDFGLQGDPPSHPALLDYLAWRFMESGWSVKALQREILLSATYQQSSNNSNAGGRAVDPDNKLLWRQNRRRLGFEAMRDSLLAAADNLDLSMGGAAITIAKPPFSNRRTVYAEVDREALPSMFRTFDFATPSAHAPQRFETTVPQQALYMMNNPFIADQARRAAARVETLEAPPGERVRALYHALLRREPTSREIELGAFFVEGQDVATVEIPEREPPTWLYGYGTVDEDGNRVASFTEFDHWSGEAFQGGDTLPDAELGWAMLNRLGGRPGDANHAVIRRWISPETSIVSLVGELYHHSSVGDGVKAYIISSRAGILWSGEVQDGMIPTVMDDSPIEAGDTLDLVVACKENPDEDAFRWHPRIYYTGDNAANFPKQDWISRFDFEGPPPAPPVPLKPWEQYAQVLLMSNEFMFVD